MIAVDEIHRWYGRTHAVRGVSFALDRGEVVGLLGPNGAGKSSTIRVIAGVLEPHGGRVTIDGRDASAEPLAARARMGYLPESAAVYSEMSVRGYLLHRAAVLGVARRERRRRVESAMQRCRVGDVAQKRCGALSKGYRQRVALAGAIVHDPSVLVLDEPTNGLDPNQLRDARSLIAELAADRTVLICSHVLGEIERVCDRAVIIGGGRVLADAAVSSLRGSQGCVAEVRGVDSLQIEGATTEARPMEGGWTRLTVTGDAGDMRERVGAALAARGAVVRELRDATESLEDVFVRVLESAGSEGSVS
ncbi:MAG: ATP-binding cassette domain-containing protein [Planctomycetota bacterium]